MIDAFWMVWSPEGEAPTVKHPTCDLARAEAARLLRLNPRCEFFVLRAISKARLKPVEAPVEHVALDDVPF